MLDKIVTINRQENKILIIWRVKGAEW